MNHLVAREFTAATDRVRDFAGLAKRVADAAFFVTDHDKRAKIETASAFDYFCGAVDINNLLDEFLGRAAKRIFRDFAGRFATTARAAARSALPVTTSFIEFCHSIYSG
jgi:hypothetical protein